MPTTPLQSGDRVGGTDGTTTAAAPYRPGSCNIGPAEIARRQQAGHAGALVTAAALAALVGLGAPRRARLVLVLPAAGAASGYLQARLRFCAGFGSRGIFNFGDLGEGQIVVDPLDRARDRRRAIEIGTASLAIGIAFATGAALIPV